jgi:DNA mismatch repair protein MutS
MRQHAELKAKHPDAILLFRVGDFYEMFAADAIVAAEILGIALTRRANVELAGFPWQTLDVYMPKLIRAGRRVAVCEQLEDPKTTTKLIKRGITELVTPGVSMNEHVLNFKENNFLAAVCVSGQVFGLALLDISTGEFLTTEGPANHVDKLLNSFLPKEVLLERRQRRVFEENFGTRWLTFEMEDWAFTEISARDRLMKQFETQSLKGFGVQYLTHGIVAAGAILHYLDFTHHSHTGHIRALTRIEEDHTVRLDKFTVRNLELLTPMSEGGKSLIDVLDRTVTPMGARLLRRWVVFPLKQVKAIEDRLTVVDYFFGDPELKSNLVQQLGQVGDLERLISKVAAGRVNPRELGRLATALAALAPVKRMCVNAHEPSLKRMGEQLNPCAAIRSRIEKELVPSPPAVFGKGYVIAKGVHAELDELRRIAFSGKDYLLQIQQRESERTGIPSLKVSYNSVFGYYIEVRHTHKDKVPADWIRKQTLTQAERYVTEELKVYEEKILGAEDQIAILESQLFNDLVQGMMEYISPIQMNAALIAQIDCLLSFALVAEQSQYIRPQVNSSKTIDIRNGRHPVIEKQLPPGEAYIPNDVFLDGTTQQIVIITGPNMAGKSALLRQTALITLMAQIGSFVPVESAQIGVVDKIFTRVGASDNISLGESTFMVEMNEAASILNNITDRSLVLFDELGRGTSTYDGISIAWAIIEYIHEYPRKQAKTLFATHYHELNEMEKTFGRIKNYNVSVRETDQRIVFLRKLERGGSEHSFGIQVAKLAGMPIGIVHRSQEILSQLEADNRKTGISKPLEKITSQREGYQLNFFQLDDPVLSQIRDEIITININNLTPVEALNKLSDIKKILK